VSTAKGRKNKEHKTTIIPVSLSQFKEDGKE
jgi:hypothetical protein